MLTFGQELHLLDKSKKNKAYFYALWNIISICLKPESNKHSMS